MNISSTSSVTPLRLTALSFPRAASASLDVASEMGPVDGFVASSAAPALASPQQAVSAAQALIAVPTPSVDIKTVQDQIAAGLPGVGVDFKHTDDFSKLNGRLATVGELKEMMAALYDESNIPYGYITDGCYARAHMMDESLRQHGINNAKMFAMGDLEAKNDLMTARWWYHVAPLVFVDGGDGQPVAKIIDPGFSREPMDPEQWVAAMNKGPNVDVDLVSAEQYYPRRGRADDDFGDSLGPAVGTLQDYSRRLWGVKKGKGIPQPPYEKPTWDKPGSGGDFVVDGKTEYIFPEGVQTSPDPAYKLGTSITGALLLQPVPEREPVSASWDNRPADFDPYRAR